MCLQLTACRWVILLEQSSAVIFLWFLGFLVSGPAVLSLSFITCRARYPVTPSCDTVLLPRATKLGFEFPSLVSYIPSALQCGCAGSCILANCLCFRRGKERRNSSGEKHVPGSPSYGAWRNRETAHLQSCPPPLSSCSAFVLAMQCLNIPQLQMFAFCSYAEADLKSWSLILMPEPFGQD